MTGHFRDRQKRQMRLSKCRHCRSQRCVLDAKIKLELSRMGFRVGVDADLFGLTGVGCVPSEMWDMRNTRGPRQLGDCKNGG